MSEIEERRQQAVEAFQDASGLGDNGWRAAEIAIETATRVRITPEIARAACDVAGIGPGNAERMTPIIEAAFRAAGFEVEA